MKRERRVYVCVCVCVCVCMREREKEKKRNFTYLLNVMYKKNQILVHETYWAINSTL